MNAAAMIASPYTAVEFKEMPANIDAEQGLLGAVLLHNDVLARVSSIVSEEHFSEALHGKIWSVIVGLVAEGKLANPITLRSYLGSADLGGITSGEYLARLSAQATSPSNAVFYAEAVRDAWARRGVISLAQTLMERAYQPTVEDSVKTMIDEAETSLSELRPTEDRVFGDFISLKTAANRAMRAAAERYRENRPVAGLSTGLPRLDGIMGGLRKTDLVVIGGRPGSGKTTAATNFAFNVSRQGGVVAFFSQEMGEEQLATRILAEQSNVPAYQIEQGKVTQQQLEAFMAAEERFQREISDVQNFYIDPSGGLSIANLAFKARRLRKRAGRIDLIVVDYIQLMNSGAKGRKGDTNRSVEIGEVTTGLKALAKDLKVPIIALSQLSRQVEARDDKRPMLSDLKESGSIEADADIVLFLYRDEYYLAQREPKQGGEAHDAWARQMRRAEGRAEIIVAKNRHGRCGIVEVGFDGDFSRFTNDPPAVFEDDEPARERKPAKPKLTDKTAVNLYGVLKTMSLTRGLIATPDQRAADRQLPKGARLILMEEARTKFGEEVLAAKEEDAKRVETEFRAAFKAIRAAEMGFYSKQGDDFYIWLPAFTSEV